MRHGGALPTHSSIASRYEAPVLFPDIPSVLFAGRFCTLSLMKRLLSLILLTFLHAASFGQGPFHQHTFAGGFAIQIPTNWKVLDASITQQLAANTEAKTGLAQGNNEILLAANLSQDKPNPSATVRLSVRHAPTLTEHQFQSIPEEEFRAQAENNRAMIELGLRSEGLSLVAYSEARETLAGHAAHTSTYVSAENGRESVNILSVIFLGDRKVKLHIAYDKASGATLKSTVDQIRASLSIPK
jgi:hypothetical protein